MKKQWMATTFLASTILFFSTNSSADWEVDNSASSLYFLSVKAAKPGAAGITETLSFDSINGQLNKDGTITLQLPLNQISTGIDIRNERMNSMLFNAEKFPQIEFKGKVEITPIEELAVGEFIDLPISGTLSISGQNKDITETVRLQSLDQNRLRVSTLAPIIVNAEDFSLTQGVDALREIAGLSSIATTVPVLFDVVLTKQ